MSVLKSFGFAALALLLLPACAGFSSSTAGASNAPYTLYLVRHAEKDLGTDPDLTPEGRARAKALVALMTEADPALVYSTNYNRTRQTAAPAALALELPIIYYDPSDLEAFADKLKQDRQSALIVGHSNTTPQLVEALGGEPGTPIVEATEYDRLYVLNLRGDEVTSELQRYGVRYQE